MHRTVFRTKALNPFFEKVYAFLSWSDYLWYRASHVRHHRATCHRDHDGEVVLPLRFSLRSRRFWLTMFAFNLPKLRRAIEHDLPPAPHGLRETWREMLAIRARAIADPAYRHTPAIPDGTPTRAAAGA